MTRLCHIWHLVSLAWALVSMWLWKFVSRQWQKLVTWVLQACTCTWGETLRSRVSWQLGNWHTNFGHPKIFCLFVCRFIIFFEKFPNHCWQKRILCQYIHVYGITWQIGHHSYRTNGERINSTGVMINFLPIFLVILCCFSKKIPKNICSQITQFLHSQKW